MTAEVEVKGARELVGYLKELPDGLYDGAKLAYQDSIRRVHRDVSGNIKTGPLHSRTGLLGKSLRTSTTGTKIGDLRSSAFSDMIYAPIHEYGGTIKAKNAYKNVPGGPYLNIPLSANLTAAGVMRQGAREVFNAGGKLFRSRRGNWLISLNGQLMFVLKKSVTIPARLGMSDAAEDEIPTLLGNISRRMQTRLEE